MFRKILVPLDGSELAEGILPYVSLLAKGLDTPIVLVSVVETDQSSLPKRLRFTPRARKAQYGDAGAESSPSSEDQSYGEKALDMAGAAVGKRLGEVAERLRAEGIQAQPVVAFGHPAEQIVSVAEEQGCGLIAMSTHGRTALGRGILGSVTDKVVHSSHLPTLTITPERAKEYWNGGDTLSTIMAPLDGSELAETALPYVTYLAEKLSLHVTLVRAISVTGPYTAYTDAYPYMGYEKIEEQMEEEASEYLKSVAARIEGHAAGVTWKVLWSPATVGIVDEVRKTPQDMVVLATHGRSGLTRWIMGSVTEALVRTSGAPVLIIPPDATKGTAGQ